MNPASNNSKPLSRNRSPGAVEFARHLRAERTEAERKLWRLLRNRRFADFKFRRQYAYGPYFLDFYCAELRIAFEPDGGGHGFPAQRAKDKQRDEFLASHGIKVVHIWNHEIHTQFETVRSRIWRELMERQKTMLKGPLHTPHPALSP